MSYPLTLDTTTVTVRGVDLNFLLTWLQVILTQPGVRELKIGVDPVCVNFKVNNDSWTSGVGELPERMTQEGPHHPTLTCSCISDHLNRAVSRFRAATEISKRASELLKTDLDAADADEKFAEAARLLTGVTDIRADALAEVHNAHAAYHLFNDGTSEDGLPPGSASAG